MTPGEIFAAAAPEIVEKETRRVLVVVENSERGSSCE